MGFRGLLIDAVGTLLQTAEPPAQVYARVARRHSLPVDEKRLQTRLSRRLASLQPPTLGNEPLERMPELEREGWRNVIRETLGDAAADGACFEELFAHYGEPSSWQVYPNANEGLARLRGAGLRTTVVSNMDARLPQLLEGLGLAPLLDEIVLPSNCGYAKPDPRIFRVALQRTRIQTSQAVYVGDREKNCLEGARKAGLTTLRFDPMGSEPDCVGDWLELAERLAP